MKTSALVRWVGKIVRWVATAWKPRRWGWGPLEAASWKPEFLPRPSNERCDYPAARRRRRHRLCSSPVPMMPYG